MSKKEISKRIRKLEEQNPEQPECYALQWDDNQAPWGYISSK